MREHACYFRFRGDYEGWFAGAPEFVLMIAGTSDTKPDAELANKLIIPEGIWEATDDDGGEWRVVYPRVGFPLVDWDRDLGNRVRISCIEEDGAEREITVQGETTIFGITVGFSTSFSVGGVQECGTNDLLVRKSTGAWTRIPDYRTVFDDSSYPEFDGTSNLHWSGYGRPIN